MLAPPKLVTAPTEEPVTLATLKGHCRVDHDDEDAYLTSLIVAAREWCEVFCNRSFLTTTWDQSYDYFPFNGVIKLQRAPLQSVASVIYYTSDSAVSVLNPDLYVVDTSREPGMVWRSDGTSWPTTHKRPGAVVVRYVAGWSDVANVPFPIKQAILLLAGDMYAHRESLVVGTVSSQLKMTVESLLWPYRIYEAC